MSARFDLGFLGGGQLARMSIQAAQRMGLKCISLDPYSSSPASQVAASIQAPLDDPGAIGKIAIQCDRLTLENEFIPANAIRIALDRVGLPQEMLTPEIDALATIQDKLLQRNSLLRAGVPSPLAVAIDGDGSAAIGAIGFPMVLKSRFGGYDGKGTRYAKTIEEFDSHRELWRTGGWLAESFVPFRREIAAMVYVSELGSGAFPTMETVQMNSVCDLVFPCETDASSIAIAAVNAVGGHGLFGVEMFELESGEILINELAPRPHNSGHYTLDWGGVSQFEQHVRLAMGLPPSDAIGGPVCMANLLGLSDSDDFQRGLRAAMEFDPGIHVHWYGKSTSRIGRKMGHLNVSGDDCKDRAVAARNAFYKAL